MNLWVFSGGAARPPAEMAIEKIFSRGSLDGIDQSGNPAFTTSWCALNPALSAPIFILYAGPNISLQMSDRAANKPGLIEQIRTSKHPDLFIVLGFGVILGILLLFIMVVSPRPMAVVMESRSMDPNINMGDIIFVAQSDFLGSIQTWDDSQVSGYIKYNGYGDVIIYRPNGADSVNPIMHRALMWVDANQTVMLPLQNGKTVEYTAAHAGYITMGDNNPAPDQLSVYRKAGGRIEPVREEWVVGKAL